MPPLTSSLGRPADRKNSILEHIRQQIVAGELSPGSRLPTRGEIRKQFAASPMTVQSALDDLLRDGFVIVNGRQGTYVSHEPPYLTRYALVFTELPQAPGWSGYYRALMREAQHAERKGERCIALYHYWDEKDGSPAGYKGYRQLQDDIQSHRLAGLIMPNWPPQHGLEETIRASHIPLVILGRDYQESAPYVALNNDSFWVKALDYLKSRGCQRIGCLSLSGNDLARTKFETLATERGLITRPYWWQVAHPHAPDTAHQSTYLMLHANQIERPDGLIISDDNFVDQATAALLAAGRHVPDDLEVVAHCNFPHPTAAGTPVQRLGYDARQIIAASMRAIDAQRRGETATNVQLEAVFERELVVDGANDLTLKD